MRFIQMVKNNERSVAAFVNEGVALLILFGQEAEPFRNRRTRVTLLVSRENGALKFEDAAGISPALLLDADAEADLRAAKIIHIVKAAGESVETIAPDAFVRWPA